ncbi:hypothetical protein FRC09_016481, partial [Ceratobasidium sp. 395]
MYAPELAPLVWRAAELTDVTDPEDIFSCAPPGVTSARWVASVVQSQARPLEDRKIFMAAVSKWCCEGELEVISAMEGAREWLEPEIWDAWVQQREKLGEGGGCKPVELRKAEGDAVMKNTYTSDCALLSRTCKTVFKVSTAFVWSNVDGGQFLLSLLGGTRIIDVQNTPGLKKIVIGIASSSHVDFSRFEIYAPYVRRLSVYGPGPVGHYYQVDGWEHLILRAQQRPLLPNLLSIILQSSCDGHGSDQLLWIKTFISPSLINIQATPHSVSSPPCVTSLMADVIMDSIAERCPRLFRLSIFPSRGPKQEENNLLGYLRRRPYRESLRALPMLMELTCSVTMLEDSFSVISSMPQLRRLIVLTSGTGIVLRPPILPRNSFPALHQLHLKGLSPYEVIAILGVPPLMSQLTHLELKFKLYQLDEDEDREEWIASDMFSLLKFSPNLQSLDLDLDPTMNLDQGYDIGHQDIMDTFSRLPLVNVTLGGVHLGDWAYTGSLKSVWPNVTSLRMRDQFASPRILSCFAQLPRVQYLLLDVHLEDFREFPKVASL